MTMSQVAEKMLSSPALSLEPGTVVGRYRLIRRLAQGGMAQLWAGEPIRGSGVQQTVAIKVIRPDIASDEKYSAMFIDEANVAMAIEHPHVCRTYELGHEGSLLYMCMEWIAGDSLAGLLRKEGAVTALEPELASRIVADALAGLHAAHEAKNQEGEPLGVIHRDVSPPNILISLSGQVKVSDFGIAKARHQLHERTKTGEVKGKFAYLAPEQITGRQADRRIDIYAMGCVLYVAAVGLRPFGNGPEAMTKILKGQVKRPSTVRPNFPLDLEEIIMRAIEKDPDARYSTAAEMRTALERWLISQKRVVTQGHIAQALSDRLPPSTRTVIESLKVRNVGQVPLDLEPVQDSAQMEPATASTKVVQSVASANLQGNDQDSDSTVRYIGETTSQTTQLETMPAAVSLTPPSGRKTRVLWGSTVLILALILIAAFVRTSL